MKKDFYIPLGNLDLNKGTKANWYIAIGGKGVLLIIRAPHCEEHNEPRRKFILNKVATV